MFSIEINGRMYDFTLNIKAIQRIEALEAEKKPFMIANPDGGNMILPAGMTSFLARLESSNLTSLIEFMQATCNTQISISCIERQCEKEEGFINKVEKLILEEGVKCNFLKVRERNIIKTFLEQREIAQEKPMEQAQGMNIPNQKCQI